MGSEFWWISARCEKHTLTGRLKVSKEQTFRTIPFDRQDAIVKAIKTHENFEIGGCQKRMGEAILFVERTIGAEGMTSRVYTKGRATALLVSMALPAVGVATTAAIAAHNLATINPDYEIAKRPIDGVLRLAYVKDDPTLGDHVSGAYRKAEGASLEAINSVTETWEKHAPSREAVTELALSAVPSFLRKKKISEQSGDAGAEVDGPGGAEIAGTNETILVHEAVQIRSLQQKLEKAAAIYEEQNRTNEFVVCLYAIGIAMAACDGHFDDEEASILKNCVLGASAAAMPSAMQAALAKLTQSPPSFDEALIYVEKLGPDAWPVIDDVLAVISQADGEVSASELEFLNKWQGYKTAYNPISKAAG